ncbi:hypothetical protein SAMN06269250_1086 [Spirosoma fluviale]|uniref:Uncharacterized protein n=1 Tax=Spirosoma fluviale TaxID=1597977 RepID=A0A286F961_9BACT|nr:hypothetical protein SAMN06269250_1086 [Spirosoma fluviale]
MLAFSINQTGKPNKNVGILYICWVYVPEQMLLFSHCIE